MDYLTKLTLQGKFAKLPLMVGATANKTLSEGIDIAAVMRVFFPSILDGDIQAVGSNSPLLQAYLVLDFTSSQDLKFQTITGSSEFGCAGSCSALEALTVGTSTGYVESACPFAPPSVSDDVPDSMEPRPFTLSQQPNEAFAEELVAYWLPFLRSGDPKTFKLPRSPVWKQYTPKAARMILKAGPEADDGQAAELGLTPPKHMIQHIA
ncbi:unnamed protein product [Cyclocybe aegerita]|uniref:Uncharacterized protein n=1 Tax=Cyclocybe aegerita TaxID=1973307 RepID=A0A8S0WPF5_CYCAE|nr:unnamed protein product [Cyclocybe aegerita]